ncbi:MAG: hypothetical protein ACTSO9_21610, partial [Candidatus Helarchaeota archaeon]
FTKNGKYLVTKSSSTIKILDLTKGRLIRTIKNKIQKIKEIDINELVIDLGNLDLKIRKKTAFIFEEMAKCGKKLDSVITTLSNALSEEDIEIRWAIADAMMYYYVVHNLHYGSWKYDYYGKYIYDLKTPDATKKLSTIKWLHEITTPDLVSDRDERDISFFIPALTVVLFDENKKVKLSAINTIRAAYSDYHDIKVAVPSIVKIALSEKDKEVQDGAIFALRGITDKINFSNYISLFNELLDINWGIADVQITEIGMKLENCYLIKIKKSDKKPPGLWQT